MLHRAFSPSRFPLPALVLFAVALAGCKSNQQKALDQAKAEAAKTGQPQQVVSVDKNGTTTTTVVQPPAPGQKNEAITTTVTPHQPGTPLPPPSAPAVRPLPPPPPQPVSITIPAGSTLAVRIDQRLSTKDNVAGDPFTGEIVDPILASDSSVLVPKGAPVAGVVAISHRRGRFRGRSELALRLTFITLHGKRYSLDTGDVDRSRKGKGKRSVAFIGGGGGLGALIGGLAAGGKGAALGGLLGGGAGTVGAGLTGNRATVIPAETVLRFRLDNDLVVRESPPEGQS